jgi:hypothetical protein
MASAYSRKLGRIPIHIAHEWTHPDIPATKLSPTQVTGLTAISPDQSSSIYINIPPSSSPIDVDTAMRHELVHASLIGATLPSAKDYLNPEEFHPPNPYSNIPVVDRLYRALTIHEPSNLYNWPSSHRGGSFYNELPAYMSIYDPRQIKVDLPTRNQYMTDLYNYLEKTKQSNKSKFIQNLIQGREAAKKIYPTKNVGNIEP